MKAIRSAALSGTVAAALVFSLAACSTIEQGMNVLGKAADAADKAEKVASVVQKFRNTFSDITEEEEYYIGRAVAAVILSKYRVYDNAPLTQYVNTMGNTVALFSDRPEIYAGYHFLVLDSGEVNALSAPGGLIFVTRGLLKRCADEEMLGLVLAHEIGHISAKHGLQAIKKSRLTEVFSFLGKQAVRTWGSAELAQATNLFEGVLDDVVQQLVVRGYDRKSELEADALAVRFAAGTGYELAGIQRFLKTMVDDKSAAAGSGWFKTHPAPELRLEKVAGEIGAIAVRSKIDSARTNRFKQVTAGVR
jgi:predicted Zn-dependent protease